MARTIGLSQKLKLIWLNKAAEFSSENLSEKEYKNKLTEYLSYEIESPTILRKTSRNLMLVWFYNEIDSASKLRPGAMELIKKYPEYAPVIHWCMLMLTFPVFRDLCHIMGRMLEFSDIITLRQLKQKLYDDWGERQTLHYSTDKIISTMKDLNVIETTKPGNYHVLVQSISDNDMTRFMLKSAMLSGNSDYYKLNELASLEVLFPFRYELKKDYFIKGTDFSVSNFGGELTVSLADTL